MPKNSALERIESHEKLCRIMQKQTHQKINNIELEIKDIKKHLYYAMSALIGGMFTIIIILFEKLYIIFKGNFRPFFNTVITINLF